MSSASTVDVVTTTTNSNSAGASSGVVPSDAELIEALRQTLSQKLNETGEEKRFERNLVMFLFF